MKEKWIKMGMVVGLGMISLMGVSFSLMIVLTCWQLDALHDLLQPGLDIINGGLARIGSIAMVGLVIGSLYYLWRDMLIK